MTEIKKGHGLDLEKELADRKPTDYIAGVGDPIHGFAEGIQHKKYLPMGETQRGREDTMDCATRWAINDAECKFTYAYQVGIIKGYPRKFLEENGYIVDGRVVFSDAFNAILSGTTENGNSMIAPLDSIHRDGLVPKKLISLESWMTWSDYNNKKRITPELLALGKKFLEIFTIHYVRVLERDFKEVLESDMIGMAGYAWPNPINGEYPWTDGPFNHAFLGFELPPYEIFDNYEEAPGDYIKNLASNYALYDYGYRLIPNIKTQEITCEMVRYAYSRYKDVADAFPRDNNFYSPLEPTYTIYDWAQEWGRFDHKEAFTLPLDWSLVDSARRVEAEWLAPQKVEGKKTFNLLLWIISCWKYLSNL